MEDERARGMGKAPEEMSNWVSLKRTINDEDRDDLQKGELKKGKTDKRKNGDNLTKELAVAVNQPRQSQ